MNLHKEFEKHDKEFYKFENIKNPPSNCPDLCAFILLDKLVPTKGDLVMSAEHDQIWLETDIKKLSKVATPKDIIYLARCGVMFDEDIECLSMFV